MIGHPTWKETAVRESSPHPDRREAVIWALYGTALVVVLVTFGLPNVGESQDYAVGEEVLFAVRRNYVPLAVVLLGAGVLLTLVALLVDGVRRVRGYVWLLVVLGVAVGSFASLPPLDRCWGPTHIDGPFEGIYHCFDITDDMEPVDLPMR